MVRIATFAALFVLVLAGAAAAQDDQDAYDRAGPYLGLAGTLALDTQLQDDLERRLSPFVDVDVDPSLGLNARAGYRFHPNFAAEIHYEWLSEFKMEFSSPALGVANATADLSGWALTVDGKVFLLTDNPQPFLLVGVGVLNIDSDFGVDKTVFAARFGGGADFYLTPNIAFTLGVSYVLPGEDIELVKGLKGVGVNYVSIGWGLQYRF
jgi:opacity protein-like surface antigen